MCAQKSEPIVYKVLNYNLFISIIKLYFGSYLMIFIMMRYTLNSN